MASLTTPARVRTIVKVSTKVCPDDASLQVFIDDAHVIVSENLSGSTIGFTAARLELIERLLAAHNYAVRDRTLQRTSQGAADVKDDFTLGLGEGLASTQYGREAMRVDTSGTLAAQDRKSRAATPQPGVIFLGGDNRDCSPGLPWSFDN